MGPSMRILQLHNKQYARGGVDIEHEREAEGLTARGHVVETMLIDNREVERIGSSRAALKAIWNHEAVTETNRRIAGFRPDIVHVHTPFPIMSPSVFVAARRAGIPVVTTSHSYRYSCIRATLQRGDDVCVECVGRRIKLPAVMHTCYKDSLPGSLAMATSLTLHHNLGTFTRTIDRFIALTPFMREKLIAEGIPADRVTVLANAAPDPGPPADQPKGSAAFIGRFIEEKGVRTILEAWRSMDTDIPLIFAGDGILRPEIEAAAAQDSRITVLPWMDSEGVARLLADAEVLIMASEWFEGLPLLIPESFSIGTPIIASDVGNFSDLIDPGRTGDRFTCGDPTDLVRSVRWFFEQADRAALRANARAEYVMNFSPDRQLDRLEEIYREVIGEHATRR
jgi:glycosyltransferase involved in cell wall biosynthesis